jgi:hypothetical protein
MVDIQREMVSANVEIGELLSSLLRGSGPREIVLGRIQRLQSALASQASEFDALAKKYRDPGLTDPERPHPRNDG